MLLKIPTLILIALAVCLIIGAIIIILVLAGFFVAKNGKEELVDNMKSIKDGITPDKSDDDSNDSKDESSNDEKKDKS